MRALLLGMWLSLGPMPASAQTAAVPAAEMKIGHITSEPASSESPGKVIGAYFKKINDEGGINGRRIRYIVSHVGESQPKAVEAVRTLVEDDQVALLLATVETPTGSAVQKFLNQHRVPHLLLANGASRWSDPKNFPWTMAWRVHYRTEGRMYARYALATIPDAKIGVLYQNDDYGRDYRKGFMDELGDRARRMVVLEQTYEVTDPTVDAQIVNLKNSGANIFVNVTIPKFAVQAIKKSNDIGWKPLHFLNNVSSSLGTVLKPAGLEASRGIITSRYLKDPTDPAVKNDAGYKEWVAFMQKYQPDGALNDDVNVFGYTVAQGLAHVLKQCGNDLSRANLMKQAASIKDLSLPLLLPGIKVNTSPTDHAAIEQAQLAKFDGERWVPFGEIHDASKK